jgi:O-antigen/teichoic acid export membrane protein
MSLKKYAVGGVKWTSMAAIISAVIQLLQIAILAHYLNKKDFGLMAIALFVIGISQIFVDMGISNSIIHKQNVNKYQLSTLFWLNIIIGGIVFAVLFLTAPLIAHFYSSPELKNVLRWIALTFVIVPFGQQFETLLRKELRFRELSVRDIAGKVVGLFLAVILAYFHWGIYALVVANLATAVVSTSLLLFHGLKDYRPLFAFSIRSLKNKGFFSFGLFQIGEQVINYFNSQFDTLLIGKLLGMEALGIYNIAKTIAYKPFQIINPIITKVSFPVMAKLQHDIPKLKVIYLKIVRFLVTTNAPVYILMIVLAKPLILIMFGKEWLIAAPILQIISLSSLIISAGNPIGALQLSRGRADLGFYWNAVNLILLPLSVFIGSFYGLIGVATSLVILRVLLIFPAWKLLIKPLCDAGFREYFECLLIPFLLALLAGLPAWGLTFVTNNVLAALIAVVLIYGLIYGILSKLFNKEMWSGFINFLPFSLNKQNNI